MGGQGVILLGTIVATAAVVYEGKHATQAPSYGTETRGTLAKSQVIISSKRIGFPEINQIDILIAMTQPALNRHVEMLSKEATIIVDSDLVKAVPSKLGRVWRIPATRLSEQDLASRSYANIIMFGALVKLTALVSPEAARSAIRISVPSGTVEKNLKAFELGQRIAGGESSSPTTGEAHL